MPSFRLKIPARRLDTDMQTGGLKFAFFYIVVFFAGINTGNNLIYLVLASLTGAVIVSWILAWMNLRQIKVNLRVPDEIYADEETSVDFYISKGRSLMPANSLTFSLKGDGSIVSHLPYLDHLEKESQEHLKGLSRFNKRGIYALAGVQIICNYPFGLVSLRKLFRHRSQLMIYPKILSLTELFFGKSEGFDSLDSAFRGRGGGLFNIRPFEPGDDYRLLHWKATAKLGAFMVQELTQEEGRAVWIHFNPRPKEPFKAKDTELFELGVSVAASLAYYGRQAGQRIMFSAPGQRLVPSYDGQYIELFLRYLAEVKPTGRLISPKARITEHREDEKVIVVDPLNKGVDWGQNTIVLDRRYIREIIEARS